MEKRQVELIRKIAEEALYALAQGASGEQQAQGRAWAAYNNIKDILSLLEKELQESKG